MLCLCSCWYFCNVYVHSIHVVQVSRPKKTLYACVSFCLIVLLVVRVVLRSLLLSSSSLSCSCALFLSFFQTSQEDMRASHSAQLTDMRRMDCQLQLKPLCDAKNDLIQKRWAVCDDLIQKGVCCKEECHSEEVQFQVCCGYWY